MKLSRNVILSEAKNLDLRLAWRPFAPLRVTNSPFCWASYKSEKDGT